MYQSFERRLIGENLIWFNSLSLKARYHLVFRWNDLKRGNPNFKLKHFLNDYKHNYKITLQNRRNAIIDHFIE
jgi:hypothetical protein